MVNKSNLPEKLEQAIEHLVRSADNDARWMLGGSCGLALQDVCIGREPRDIDIYADQADAKLLHSNWLQWSVDEPKWDETERYLSLLSHYKWNEATIELVGDFVVHTSLCCYETSVRKSLWQHSVEAQVGEVTIRLMPLAHELVFNLLREREDRVQAIAGTMNLHQVRHVAALRAVLAHCNPQQGLQDQLLLCCPDIVKAI
ncbi:hypothetical protein [Paenibacillus sp. 481]|uniref:hypothetical protein n=1 Tax=Paenibacillus sp. 481 TaxID=2835869 RepID=UPI001E38DC34|nr:hypothetical protein [Paenibacillus sp. 481]UHA72953.1 hypothetical protein KIK04_20435 [Paenibacillus sp. 481]